MDLRPLEPEHLPALSALCVEPAIARNHDLDPAALDGLLQTAPGTHAAIGAFEGDVLLGAAGMSANDRPRLRHAGHAWLVSPPKVARELLGALGTLALDWWKLDRVDLSLPAGSDLDGAAVAAHFEREVVRRGDLELGGERLDSVGYALVRPHLQATPSARTFERGPRGPLPASLEIRTATPDDAAGFARVVADPSVLWGTLQLPFTSVAFWRKRLVDNAPERNERFVALVDGEIVASAGLHGAREARRAHVWGVGMTVRAPFQGCGVGAVLMDVLLQTAERLAIPRVELEVYVDNTRAVALYEKHGFVREGVRRLESFRDGAYTDALVMARLR
jgi:putative acetyltransferase